MYEGRTRGKRIKYTYSDDEDFTFSDSTTRRSTRNTGGTNTPADAGPVTTSSGRQIRAPPRLNAATGGDSAADSGQGEMSEFDRDGSTGPTGRPRRSAARTNGWTGSNGTGSRSRRNGSAGSDDDEEDDVSEGEFGDDEDEHVPEEEEEDEEEYDEDVGMLDDELADQTQSSLVVKLSLTPPKLKTALDPSEPQDKEADAKTEGAPAPTAPAEATGPAEDAMDVDTDSKTKAKTPEPEPERAAAPAGPLAERSANLALRGSPEKVTQEHQQAAQHVPAGEVVNGE